MIKFFLTLTGFFITISDYGQIVNVSDSIPISLVGIIPMPAVTGRIDHMAFNNKMNCLYVVALGNNSLEVIDLKNKKVIHSLNGLDEPQGIGYVPETNSIVVANGGNGELKVYDATTYKMINSVKPGDDADNVRYNPVTKTIYVGYGNGAIAGFDALTLKQCSDIELSGHPESFQLDSENTLYVNVPDKHLIEVVDLKQNKIIEKWTIREASGNFPMALDEVNSRLFIGCRSPAKLFVLDTHTGKTITRLDADSDADDIFFDNFTHYIYMSCGSGFIDIYKQLSPDGYTRVRRIESGPGARTSLHIPDLDQYVVAVPARSGKMSRLMIYSNK